MQARDLSRGEKFGHNSISETMTEPAPAPPALHPVRWLNNQPYLLLSLTSLFWAGNIVLARHVAGHVPPMTLSCVRWIGTFLILLPFAWPHLKRDWPALRAHLPLMVLLSAIGFAFNNAISYWAHAVYRGAERASDPVGGTAVRGAVVAGAVRRAADRRATRRHHASRSRACSTIILRGDFAALAGISFNKGDLMFASFAGVVRAVFGTDARGGR